MEHVMDVVTKTDDGIRFYVFNHKQFSAII